MARHGFPTTVASTPRRVTLDAAARVWRIVRLAALFLALALFAQLLGPRIGREKRERFRTVWTKAVLRALGVELVCERPVLPRAGPALLAANHVSSIDALLIGALHPVRFVAKSQLAARTWLRWPLTALGTIFIDRSRRAAVLHVLARMREAFEANEAVALFPEATVTGEGDTRRFNSALLEPASRGVPLYLMALRLNRVDGLSCPEADFAPGRGFASSFWRLSAVPAMVVHAAVVGPLDFSGLPRKRIASIAQHCIRELLSGTDARGALGRGGML
jgi:1-acyl-sn-glycerol-3-phosphate acyltransferase